MQIVKEMHEALDIEERLIEGAEADINAQLRNINVRRGILSLKRLELRKIHNALDSMDGRNVAAGDTCRSFGTTSMPGANLQSSNPNKTDH